jgi:hypothetical protein
MDPAFPDIVGQWAVMPDKTEAPANEYGRRKVDVDELAESVLLALARLDIDATRLW